MIAIWSLDTEAFYQSTVKVKNNELTMAVVKNNAYHYELEFTVKTFLKAEISTFSTTSLNEAIRARKITPEATIFLVNPVYDLDLVKRYDIHMILPSLNHHYKYKQDLKGIHVHLEYENLLHRSGFKNIEEIHEILKDHDQNNQDEAITSRMRTYLGYVDGFDVDEYEMGRDAWLDLINTFLNENYHFDMIHSQNSASYFRENQMLLPHHTHVRVGIVLYGPRPYSLINEEHITQSLIVKGNVIQVRDANKGGYCGYSFASEVKNDHAQLAVVDIGYDDGILKSRAKHEAIINGKRYPIRALMMSHMFIKVNDEVHAQNKVILYNKDICIDEFTFKDVGANSEQLSAMNHDSLMKEYL